MAAKKKHTAAPARKADIDTPSAGVRVIATEPGYLGDRYRNRGDVFVLQLEAGQDMPSWLQEVTSDDVPITPVSHADPDVKTNDGNDVL